MTRKGKGGGPKPPGFVMAVGLALLGAAAVLSTLLSLGHLAAVGLPGCGPGSACDQAARSPWAKLPVLDLPIAFLGLGFDVAAIVLWLRFAARLTPSAMWFVRIGALASVFYTIVAISSDLLCPYCLAAHALHLVFWLLAERIRSKGTRRAPTGLPLAIAAMVLVVAPFWIMMSSATKNAKAKAEQELKTTTSSLADPSKKNAGTTPPAAEIQPAPAAKRFEGRYRLGPEQAAVRIVVFTDYQCPDCKLLEAQIEARVRADPRLACSVKQFPLSKLCNPKVEQEIHPDACWGARAAEVAGHLGGADAFWRMSHWLFERSGSFGEPDLRAAVASMGFDADRFVSMLESPDIASRIRADIDEAAALGIRITPMIFINGIELKGWTAPNAVDRGIDAALATNPPPRDASFDRPPMAREKFINDWREKPVSSLPPEVFRRSLGASANAPGVVDVVVFGDYLEPNSRQVDAEVRAIAARADIPVRYSFQHFPFDQNCNPMVPRTRNDQSCAIARLVEAAGVVGGIDAFWRAHAWAYEDMARSEKLSREGLAINTLAEHLAMDAGALLDAVRSAPVSESVTADCRRAQALGLTRIPWVYINGKIVEELEASGERLVPVLIREAARGAK